MVGARGTSAATLIDVTQTKSSSDLEEENAKMNRVVKSICRGC